MMYSSRKERDIESFFFLTDYSNICEIELAARARRSEAPVYDVVIAGDARIRGDPREDRQSAECRSLTEAIPFNTTRYADNSTITLLNA
jgi:hypothetical protein